MARAGWEYRTSGSYTINSYGKPALTLQTLEGLLGDETMTRIMRTFARRYRFAHPTTADFIATVNEVDREGLPVVLRRDVLLERARGLHGRGGGGAARRLEGWSEGRTERSA